MARKPPCDQLTDESISLAETLIRDAELTLVEFEEQVEGGFSFTARFVDREYATTLAERFEHFRSDASNVPGSIAWIVVGGMETLGVTPLPKLDELMHTEGRITRRKLRKVLQDHREEMVELKAFYRVERLKIRSKREHQLFQSTRRRLAGS